MALAVRINNNLKVRNNLIFHAMKPKKKTERFIASLSTLQELPSALFLVSLAFRTADGRSQVNQKKKIKIMPLESSFG